MEWEWRDAAAGGGEVDSIFFSDAHSEGKKGLAGRTSPNIIMLPRSELSRAE